MTETTQEERNGAKPILEQTVRIDRQRKEAGLDRQSAALDCDPKFALRLIHDVNRLARLESAICDLPNNLRLAAQMCRESQFGPNEDMARGFEKSAEAAERAIRRGSEK